MLQNSDGTSFQSPLLCQFDAVIHGFSGRLAGDMEKSHENRDRFVRKLFFKNSPVLAEQIHGNRVEIVDRHAESIVSGVDGLVSRDVPVAVVVADCVPVLLVDPFEKVYAAVHAGWKGTLGYVTGNAVKKMVDGGADRKHIYAAIGPHIGACCYDVPGDRMEAFIKRFGRDEKMAVIVGGRWHLDIGWVNYRQLIKEGLSSDHIDAPPTCTSCQNTIFFSYRKEIKRTYGEMMAVIGLKIL